MPGGQRIDSLATEKIGRGRDKFCTLLQFQAGGNPVTDSGGNTFSLEYLCTITCIPGP